MSRTWERLALIGAAVIIIASAIFYVYVDRFSSTNSTRIEDTKVNADGINTIDENPRAPRATRTIPPEALPSRARMARARAGPKRTGSAQRHRAEGRAEAAQGPPAIDPTTTITTASTSISPWTASLSPAWRT